ncbi:MAG: septal ring lytic transglycosylase RlpA family protein [Bacteroidales bacterium]|nr:septal ring lytic transglycosylase RlpA family protein [Bacteroidales bacterium]
MIWLLLLLAAACPTTAQYYSSSDTVTEYPNHGTFYHDMFVGRKTASGEVFDQNKFTAAHWRIKLGTYILVTNRNTGLQVIVKVNDRCPKRGVIDLTRRAAAAIGIRGCQPVTVRILPDSYAEKWAAQDSKFDLVAARRTTNTSSTATKKQTDDKIPEFKSTTEGTAGYRLSLGTVASHSEAYEHIEKLPETYRDKVLIEQLADDSLNLILDMNLSQQNAEALRKGLKNLFPNARIEPHEK